MLMRGLYGLSNKIGSLGYTPAVSWAALLNTATYQDLGGEIPLDPATPAEHLSRASMVFNGSIIAFQANGPGSTPGGRSNLLE